ncbi:MAG: hypothetical protein FWH36_08420 [Lentimicrobiaceae bacterium]|nr:hypothetical protein [Lentimicrobiaceae bacterium]
MRKVIFSAVAVVALVVVFGACKKDRDENGRMLKATGEVPYTDFDYTANYFSAPSLYADRVVQHLAVEYYLENGNTTGNPYYPVNPWFADFQVQNKTTGKVYPSFCSHYDSRKLGGDGNASHNYVDRTWEFIMEKGWDVVDDITSAFNYIYDHYGSLDKWPTQPDNDPRNATKMITNVVIWRLTQDGITDATVVSPGYEYINDAITDVFANYKNYSGEHIVDFVFLADPNYPDYNSGILPCQPQIVPIYGEDGDFFSAGGATFYKMKMVGGELEHPEAGEFEFELWKTDGDWISTTQVIDENCGYPFVNHLFAGMVSAYLLDPGKYVFKEKASAEWQLDIPAGIDGLYFEIQSDGKAVWRDAFMQEDQTVVNVPKQQSTCVSFAKDKDIPTFNGQFNRQPAGEGEFSFDLYQKNAAGTYVKISGGHTTDALGEVKVCDLEPGNYQFKELAKGNWDVKTITFSIDANGVVTGDINSAGPNGSSTKGVVNTPKMGSSYGSVTATWDKAGYLARINASLNPKNGNAQFPQSYNAGVVYNSNHFTYAKYTRSQLEGGVEMAMVVGNKYDYVGKATAQIVGNNIEIKIYGFAKGNFGVMAFNKPMTDKMPKNGNIHSQKAADLTKDLGATTGFDHNNNYVVPCPSGNDIYLYIHCGSIQYYLPVQ